MNRRTFLKVSAAAPTLTLASQIPGLASLALGQQKDFAPQPGASPVRVSLAFESETSGGLLFSVRPERAGEVLPAFERRGEPCWEIGEVVADPVIRIRP